MLFIVITSHSGECAVYALYVLLIVLVVCTVYALYVVRVATYLGAVWCMLLRRTRCVLKCGVCGVPGVCSYTMAVVDAVANV